MRNVRAFVWGRESMVAEVEVCAQLKGSFVPKGNAYFQHMDFYMLLVCHQAPLAFDQLLTILGSVCRVSHMVQKHKPQCKNLSISGTFYVNWSVSLVNHKTKISFKSTNIPLGQKHFRTLFLLDIWVPIKIDFTTQSVANKHHLEPKLPLIWFIFIHRLLFISSFMSVTSQ